MTGSADAQKMIVAARELLEAARSSARSIGAADESATALTILTHAYGMAIAEACGPDASSERIAAGIRTASTMLHWSVSEYVRLGRGGGMIYQ